MENQVKKSNCTTVVVIGVVFIVAAIFLSPILYGEYKYRRCVSLAAEVTANSKVYKEFKNFIYYDAVLRLQCYGSAFGE